MSVCEQDNMKVDIVLSVTAVFYDTGIRHGIRYLQPNRILNLSSHVVRHTVYAMRDYFDIFWLCCVFRAFPDFGQVYAT